MIYTYAAIGLGVVAVLCLIGARFKPKRRISWIWAAASAGAAAIAAWQIVFWLVPVGTLMTIWALFTCTNALTTAWRVKVGMTLAIALGAALSFYPTIHDEIICSDSVDEAMPDTCPLKMNAMIVEDRAELELEAEAGNKGLNRWLLTNMTFRMVRGLDLKGGLRLVYTVDVEEAIKDKRDQNYDALREKLTVEFGLAATDDPKIEEMQKLAEQATLSRPRDRTDTVLVTFNDPAKAKEIMKEGFLTLFRREMLVVPSADGKQYTFTIRNDVEANIRESAVKQAKQTINRRVDTLGVKEAAISIRDEDIIIEIPGQDERAFSNIRDIISQTARLEFKILDDQANFFEKFTTTTDVEGLRFDIENAPLGPGRSAPTFFARLTSLRGESMEDALKRFKEWTATLPVDEDHEIGYEKVYEYIEEKNEYKAVGWRTYYLWAKAELTGNEVRNATAQADQSDTGMGQWYVQMDLAPRGAEIFENITEANVKKRFAIILDGKVESAPEIREKIGGGTARITMGAGGVQQQYSDSKKLELVLKSGALPAPISPTNEQRIGPSLGADSIDKGVKATGLGALLVLVLMFMSYRRAGIIANFAVFFNLALQLTVLSMFSASMTLPGIAGLALTIGMAVDANVLINERIKEELRAGKSARAAVQIGYDRAFTAIIDGNATTAISALILAQYGTGPIKGFAVTLFIGMCCNLFTGVLVTRLFFEFWVRGRKKVNLGIA